LCFTNNPENQKSTEATPMFCKINLDKRSESRNRTFPSQFFTLYLNEHGTWIQNTTLPAASRSSPVRVHNFFGLRPNIFIKKFDLTNKYGSCTDYNSWRERQGGEKNLNPRNLCRKKKEREDHGLKQNVQKHGRIGEELGMRPALSVPPV